MFHDKFINLLTIFLKNSDNIKEYNDRNKIYWIINSINYIVFDEG